MQGGRQGSSVRSHLLRATVGLLLIVSTAACGQDDEAPPLQTIRVGVLSATDQLPHYVLVEEGFGRDEGLQIEEVSLDSGAQILEGLRAGTLDVGVVGVPPLMAAAQAGTVPSEIVGVMAAAFVTPENPLFGVLVGPDVRSWSDLSGEPVGVNTPISLGGTAIVARLEQEGVKPTDLVEVPFANQGLGVRSGELRAAVMIDPYLTQSLERGDGRMLDWVVGGPPMTRVQASVLVARTELIDGDPGLVEAYLRAELTAIEWIGSHNSDAREALARRLKVTSVIAAKIRLPLFAADGRNDPAQMQAIMDLMATPDLPAPPPEDLVDERLLTAVLQER